jgi:hypothetical protein
MKSIKCNSVICSIFVLVLTEEEEKGLKAEMKQIKTNANTFATNDPNLSVFHFLLPQLNVYGI